MIIFETLNDTSVSKSKCDVLDPNFIIVRHLALTICITAPTHQLARDWEDRAGVPCTRLYALLLCGCDGLHWHVQFAMGVVAPAVNHALQT